MKNFALIGAAGFIAPRHLKAIKETGNNLVAALDTFDSVGIMDSYFPKADFFTEFERFDRHISKIKYEKNLNLDYISICTPNYLHDSNIRFALRQGADAICEKPLVLNPWNIDALSKIENETGKKVYTILQLRHHASIIALKQKIDSDKSNKIHDIDLTYITSRGNWYYTSWKGDVSKSGGVASNIGVHFFDMLTWIFGDLKENIVHLHNHDRAGGVLQFEKANVRWFLSIDANTLPQSIAEKGQTTYRSIKMDGEEIEFSDGFKDLHTVSYQNILDKKGFGLEDAKKSIEIIHSIRKTSISPLLNDYHPFAKLPLAKHPFEL
uniref:Gfo/Idh/MocA family oxidoreductase n=1 Tax=Flavobacterium sp. TaxID=239 RepID=UPI004049C92A